MSKLWQEAKIQCISILTKDQSTKDMKQNQTERIYETINGFDLRTGRFNNPNEGIKGEPIKFEIRILHEDPELIITLLEKIKEWIQ